jgi:hypothetical protein
VKLSEKLDWYANDPKHKTPDGVFVPRTRFKDWAAQARSYEDSLDDWGKRESKLTEVIAEQQRISKEVYDILKEMTAATSRTERIADAIIHALDETE